MEYLRDNKQFELISGQIFIVGEQTKYPFVHPGDDAYWKSDQGIAFAKIRSINWNGQLNFNEGLLPLGTEVKIACPSTHTKFSISRN